MELVDHGVDAAGHAPATTDQHHDHDHDRDVLRALPFDPWQPGTTFLDLDPDPFADALAEAREA
jgi:hypothetical protein